MNESTDHVRPWARTLGPWLFVATITAAAGAVYGHYSHRFSANHALQVQAERLQGLPADVGPWRLLKEEPFQPHVQQILNCTASMHRQYVHRETGATVGMALVLGPHGPIAVHVPEICYSSRDNIQIGPREKAAFGDDELWQLTFRSATLEQERLRVYYGWCDGHGWVAASNPRFGFAGRPFLFKLQVSAALPSGAAHDGRDPAREFLNEFLPVARTIFNQQDAQAGD